MRKAALLLIMLLAPASVANALDKNEILVVYNENFVGSEKLAKYYAEKRSIPQKNIISINAVNKEWMSRVLYLETIQKPIKAWLDANNTDGKIRCILLMRGVPLKVDRLYHEASYRAYKRAGDLLRPHDRKRSPLLKEKARLEKDLKAKPRRHAVLKPKIAALNRRIAKINKVRDPVYEKLKVVRKAWDEITFNTNVSVDSELSVMYFDNNPLIRWLPNLLNYRYWKHPAAKTMPRTYMVCRLDAPTAKLVRRIIDDSIAVEKIGLEGTVYFDARGFRLPTKPVLRKHLSWYAVYDVMIRRAAEMTKKTGMKTVLDNKASIFPKGSCPDTAIYWGWYRLGRYEPSSTFNPGSIGMHLASGEAGTLRHKASQAWCKRMIEEGVATTFGPVYEPYLRSFPDPSTYLALVFTGKYTVAEAFWYTKPWNSWMLVCVCDPLYTPFKKNPKMTVPQMIEVLKFKLDLPILPEKDEKKPAEKKDTEKKGK